MMFKILIIFVLLYGVAYSNSSNWLIQLDKNRTIPAQELNFEKDSMIVFIDEYNLERQFAIGKIKTIFNNNTDTNLINVIVLKDSSRIIGKIREYIPGKKLNVIISQDSSILLETSEITGFYTKIRKKIPDKYIGFGMSLGYPAAVNFNFECAINDFGGRINTGYLFISYGIEGEIFYNFLRTKHNIHSISICGGSSMIKKDKFGSQGILSTFYWDYIGSYYTINFYGFFISGGLSYGKGDYKEPNFIFKIGYMKSIVNQ